MKRIIVILYLALLLPVSCFANEFLEVYDSSTGNVSKIEVDTSKDFLSGQAPKMRALGIIGEDDRSQVINSAVVLLYNYDDEEEGGKCSGALVGEYVVLTAAHCVVDDAGRVAHATRITAYAGGSNGTKSKGYKIYLPVNARENIRDDVDSSDTDYALIVLMHPLGKRNGTLGVKKVRVKPGDKVTTLGFPGDQDDSKPWRSDGAVTKIYRGFFEHDADAVTGNSGGPVFLTDDLTSVIAVESYEDHQSGINGASKPADHALISFVEKYRDEVVNITPVSGKATPIWERRK